MCIRDREFIFPLKSRYLKYLRKIEKGYHVFGISINNEILGDVCGIIKNGSDPFPKHPDLKLLNLKVGDSEAYMFDMHISPDIRGGGLVNYFLGEALTCLKNKGITKVYGYYFSDHLQGLWMHKTMGYTEKYRKNMQRFIMIRRIVG